MITSPCSSPRCGRPLIPVSTTRSTGPPMMSRCSTSSRRTRRKLALAVHRRAFHHAQALFTGPVEVGRARFAEEKVLERPDQKGSQRDDEEQGRDAENEGIEFHDVGGPWAIVRSDSLTTRAPPGRCNSPCAARQGAPDNLRSTQLESVSFWSHDRYRRADALRRASRRPHRT